jgi:hypothetical protein
MNSSYHIKLYVLCDFVFQADKETGAIMFQKIANAYEVSEMCRLYSAINSYLLFKGELKQTEQWLSVNKLLLTNSIPVLRIMHPTPQLSG